MNRLFVPLLLLMCLCVPSYSGAVSCHCFQDRAFDPAAPAKADDFVLATARNALAAHAFGLPKADVVRARMGGASEADLWIAHRAGAEAGTPPSDFLDARAGAPSWKAALASLNFDPRRLGAPFAAALAAGRPDAETASPLADPFLLRLAAANGELLVKALRDAGADNAEAAAALLLHNLTKKPPVELLRSVRAGAASWGGLFHEAGVAADAVDDLLLKTLR